MDKAELYSMYEAIEGYKKDIAQISDKMDSIDYEEYKSIIDNLDQAVKFLRSAKMSINYKIRNR